MTEPGTLLTGRYRLLEQLARGGMGAVWLARDETLQREVAVKVLHAQAVPGGTDAELAAERAMREARITARLHHPNAVPVFDVVEHAGRPCLVMQYLPSRSLQAILDDRGPLPVPRVARIGAEVAAALAAAHRIGIIHRDVKPANVLVTEDGSAKLTDFGISQSLGDSSLTSVGFVTGTPAYLAPEVARGGSAGFASDVYSLGSTLYRAVEGRTPYGAEDDAMAILERAASGRVTPPVAAGALSPLVRQMLSTDPSARPPMHNVAIALREIADGTRSRVVSAGAPRPAATTAVPTVVGPAPRPVGMPPAAPLTAPAGEPERRGRGVWIAVAVVVLLLVAGGATWFATRSGDRTPSAGASSSPAASAASTPPPSDSPSAADPASDTPSAADTPSTSASPSASASSSGAPTAAQLTDAITSYYALLPGDTDAGWQRLTADYQVSPSGGRSGYDRFWGRISAVAVSDVQATPPGTVVATLRYTFTDGSTSTERTSFGLVQEDGVLKINSSQVLGRG